ncbi:FUSC family protein [Lacinutrix sp. MedPE-SW]|uniref:FUSC family protein n=1 Tax=Lacinutrix sp. MedPE-SW TaxID=1860087 RepID=UPI0009208058|nr:FUSC family protein [Lacinutrix sp. MedPE-SW]OIQ24062.1 MAG: FUSC family protein [Lacinutrix sp. MedPE-SW]
MRKTAIYLGLIFSIIAVVLAALPFSNFAFVPAILAFIFGLIAFFKSKTGVHKKSTIQLIFLLTIIALALATYKSVYTVTEVGDTEQLEQREDNSLEESIEELDDIDISE